MWHKLPDDWSQQLPENWRRHVRLQNLQQFLQEELEHGHIIYPPEKDRWTAFEQTHFDNVKVVIVGQDPYHGPNQAHGLSFSVRDGEKLPPSLKNIFKELHDDLGMNIPASGNLSAWAQQGVLLLNTSLSVRSKEPASHQNQGWEEFTDMVLTSISEQKQHVAFVLWGAHAQKKTSLIDTQKHAVFSSAHPSPFSVHRGFFGSRPFSAINSWLESHHQTPVDWDLKKNTPPTMIDQNNNANDVRRWQRQAQTKDE